MFEEDPILKPARALEDMSLEELAARIVSLEVEITRCQAEIEKKEAVKKAAQGVFGGD